MAEKKKKKLKDKDIWFTHYQSRGTKRRGGGGTMK